VGTHCIVGVGVSQMAAMTAEGGHRVKWIGVAHLVVTGQTSLSGGLAGPVRLMFLDDNDDQEKEKQQGRPGLFHGSVSKMLREPVMAGVISTQDLQNSFELALYEVLGKGRGVAIVGLLLFEWVFDPLFDPFDRDLLVIEEPLDFKNQLKILPLVGPLI